MAKAITQTPERLLLILGFIAFLGVGITSGLLGVAWPSIRAAFGLPLEAAALLFATSTLGFALGGVTAGQLVERMGIRTFLILTNGLAAAGLLGYALAPSWAAMVVIGLLAGFGAGSTETALNVYVSETQSVRTMNWMHACFGVGAAIGPLLMTASIGAGLSWRVGYAAVAFTVLVIGLGFFLLPSNQRFLPEHSTNQAAGPSTGVWQRISYGLRQPVILASVALFFLYVGLEVTAAQWAFTVFTESRSAPVVVSGIFTSVYWAMLTLGRIVFGARADRIGVERLLRLSMIGAVLASGLMVVRINPIAFAGFALLGLTLSTIFPTLTSDTPNRVGRSMAAATIGYQTAASSAGVAFIPGLAGILASRTSLEIIMILLVVTAVAMLVMNEVALAFSRRRAAGLHQGLT